MAARDSASLHVEDLHKTYGSTVALAGVSFEVRPGEIFGFVGSNGAGKSTTMRIILGVQSADAGRVRIGDHVIDLALRRRIGYMPEERGLYPKMKVGEQLVYLARLHGLSRTEATTAMERWTERLGIEARRTDTIDALSLGNQQRVQLAAALVHDPTVLVLDEPFSGLDPVAVDVMSAVLREKANDGVPVIFSSHQLELVERLSDRVGIIASGSLAALGTVDELRGQSPLHIDIDAPAAPENWSETLPGVRVVSRMGSTTRVELAAGTDDQAVLAAALTHGPVHGFTYHRPSLVELYREVVSA